MIRLEREPKYQTQQEIPNILVSGNILSLGRVFGCYSYTISLMETLSLFSCDGQAQGL